MDQTNCVGPVLIYVILATLSVLAQICLKISSILKEGIPAK
jgi:hypothetical protein